MSESLLGTIGLGEVRFCNIVNDDIAPKLIVIKNVVNNDGHGWSPATHDAGLRYGCRLVQFPGSNTICHSDAERTDRNRASRLPGTLGSNCSWTIAIGETKTRVITNDIPVGMARVRTRRSMGSGGLPVQPEFRKANWHREPTNSLFDYNVVTDSPLGDDDDSLSVHQCVRHRFMCNRWQLHVE
jgi:hypothetical protein